MDCTLCPSSSPRRAIASCNSCGGLCRDHANGHNSRALFSAHVVQGLTEKFACRCVMDGADEAGECCALLLCGPCMHLFHNGHNYNNPQTASSYLMLSEGTRHALLPLLLSKVDDLEREKDEWRSRQEESDRMVAELRARVGDSEREGRLAEQAARDELREKQAAAKEALEKSKKEAELLLKKNFEKIEKLDRNLTRAERKCADLEDEVDGLEKEVEELKKELAKKSDLDIEKERVWRRKEVAWEEKEEDYEEQLAQWRESEEERVEQESSGGGGGAAVDKLTQADAVRRAIAQRKELHKHLADPEPNAGEVLCFASGIYAGFKLAVDGTFKVTPTKQLRTAMTNNEIQFPATLHK